MRILPQELEEGMWVELALRLYQKGIVTPGVGEEDSWKV